MKKRLFFTLGEKRKTVVAMMLLVKNIFLFFLGCTYGLETQEELSIYPIIMPLIVPAQNEVYLCTSIDLSQTNETFYIRGFEPRVTDGKIHHMALAGKGLIKA